MRRLFTFVLIAMTACAICVRAADVSPEKSGTNRDDKKKEERAKEAEKRREEFNKLSPEEKEAKRKEFKTRLEKRISELRCKQTNGALSQDELRELQRRETLLKRFDQGATNAPAKPSPSPLAL